jgi:competence protein ComGD
LSHNKYENHFECQGQKGFTLSEILVVLSVFIMLATLSVGLYPGFVKKMEVRQYLKRFTDDLYYAQEYSISHDQYSLLVVMQVPEDNKSYYQISSLDGKILVKRPIPSGVNFERGTLQLKNFITNKGSFTSSGTWYINDLKDSYRVTFNIGKGRFRIEKV